MYLHVFGATQLVCGSVTLARCASLPYGYSWILPLAAECLISEFLCTVLPSRILGVRRCGWPYVASLHVHLTLRTKRCSESVVVSLLHLLLPYFSQLRLTRTPRQMAPLQPWLETALEEIRMCSLEHKNRGPTLQVDPLFYA